MKHFFCVAIIFLLSASYVQAADVPYIELRGEAGSIGNVRFSPDGKKVMTIDWFAICDEDNRTTRFDYGFDSRFGSKTVQVWDIDSGKELQRLEHTGGIHSARFFPDGKKIVTAGREDRTIRIWDAESGEELRQWEVPATIFYAIPSPDGRKIVTVSMDTTTRIWDAESGEELHTLEGQVATGNGAISPDGTKIVTTSGEGGTIRIWDAESGKELHAMEGHTRSMSIWTAIFTPDGKKVATGSGDRTARIWDAESGEELHTLEGHGSWVWFVAFSPDESRIVTSGADGSTRIWDALSGRALHELEGLILPNYCPAPFSLDGTKIVTTGRPHQRAALVYDIESGRELLKLTGHTGSVRLATFSPDGRKIVTVSGEDGTVRIWDVESLFRPPIITDF